jgi:hypothetical protein
MYIIIRLAIDKIISSIMKMLYRVYLFDIHLNKVSK